MRMRRVPPLNSEIRRALIGYRFRALLRGEDANETFLSLWLFFQGLLYAAPADSTGQAPAFHYVHELGGDWLLVALLLPLGLVKTGCAMRPVIASVVIHKSALMVSVGITLFLAIMTWVALPWSSVPVTYLLLAMLSTLTFLDLDRS